MPNKLNDYFGIDIGVTNVSQEKKYDEVIKTIVAQTQKLEEDVSDFDIYVFRLDLSKKDRYLKVSPFTERLAKLVIMINISKSVSEKKLIKLLNPYIKTAINPAVSVLSLCNSMKYTIPASYWEKEDNFSDYLAVIVNEQCYPRDKKLTVSITAHATDKYKKKLLNNPTGTVTSKEIFYLKDGIAVKR